MVLGGYAYSLEPLLDEVSVGGIGKSAGSMFDVNYFGRLSLGNGLLYCFFLGFASKPSFHASSGGAVMCWACSTAREVKVLYQPDGGKGK
jgi:hypothetical protein